MIECTIMMQQPVPKVWTVIFAHSRKWIFVHNPLGIKKKMRSMLFICYSFFQSLWAWTLPLGGLLLCSRFITINPALIISVDPGSSDRAWRSSEGTEIPFSLCSTERNLGTRMPFKHTCIARALFPEHLFNQFQYPHNTFPQSHKEFDAQLFHSCIH